MWGVAVVVDWRRRYQDRMRSSRLGPKMESGNSSLEEKPEACSNSPWRRTRDATWAMAEASPLSAALHRSEKRWVIAVISVNTQFSMSSQSSPARVSRTSSQTVGGMIRPRANGSVVESAMVLWFVVDPKEGTANSSIVRQSDVRRMS